MRKRHSDSGADEAAIDLTPMLDIVFIMLIFFIVTTSFVKESGVEINRPSASTAETVKKGNIMVAVRENGQVWVDKRVVEVGAVRANIERLTKQQISIESVPTVADLRARNPAWGVRWLHAVQAEAAAAGLQLVERLAMPANNQLLVFRR